MGCCESSPGQAAAPPTLKSKAKKDHPVTKQTEPKPFKKEAAPEPVMAPIDAELEKRVAELEEELARINGAVE